MDPLRVFAAGSLKPAMTEIADAFTRGGELPVALTFGPSGLLRERIENGEPADVLASADVGHPQRLADARRALPPRVFTRNELCALVAPGIDVDSANLLDRMLDPGIKLGTSTPHADPSGDYAWQVFARAERVRPDAFAALERKALQLTGSGAAAPAPPGRTIYGELIARRRADVFLTYRTNAIVAIDEVPGASLIELPAELAVSASYALTVLVDAAPTAARFAQFVTAASAQAILARHGFASISPS